MRESRIEGNFTKWCKQRGIVARKYVTPGRNGSPDHIFFYESQAAFIEFKQPGKTPDPLQLEEMKILKQAGMSVAWFDNATDAKEWLCEIFEIGR